MSSIKVIGVWGWGSGRAAAPPPCLENFQGNLCFQGKRKLLKNPEWDKIFKYSKKSQGRLYVSRQAQVVQNPEW